MSDAIVILWLAFMLFGYAMSLYFQGGAALGLEIDLFLPVYAAMIVGVIVMLLRPPAADSGAADRGGPTGRGDSAHA
jgi:hypothetical protein